MNRFMNRFVRLLSAVALCAALAACATSPSSSNGSASATGGEGYYKVGKPYQIDGQWYYPHTNYSYDQTGIASWYGPKFNGQRTANGEIFSKNELTAAHRTLPMPTLARVTNLENGRSIVVRINDRGPYARGRIVDVSERAAQLLGFERQGTARVRVQVLADESKAIADAMRHYGSPATPAEEQLAQAQQARPMESETLVPVRTTPAIHQKLLETYPVQQVVHVPVAVSTRLYIQAGAFTVPENAAAMQQKLASLGKTSISTITINGVRFYRVRVGPVATVGQADALLSRIQNAGVSAARTVVD
ncbi:MAG: septal ring lytic transglycosylase RlpA family protein [Alphaproteobacteria bacterium]|nr:septal ring lytic transglycosylase RlpA family protein [Alphaproteobacteria bacterium]